MELTFLERLKNLQKRHPNPSNCVDDDIAIHELAVMLGIVKRDPARPWDGVKWLTHAANPIGDWLCMVLVQMTELGILGGEVGGRGVWASDFDLETLDDLLDPEQKETSASD